jgi:hypothetical protein
MSGAPPAAPSAPPGPCCTISRCCMERGASCSWVGAGPSAGAVGAAAAAAPAVAAAWLNSDGRGSCRGSAGGSAAAAGLAAMAGGGGQSAGAGAATAAAWQAAICATAHWAASACMWAHTPGQQRHSAGHRLSSAASGKGLAPPTACPLCTPASQASPLGNALLAAPTRSLARSLGAASPAGSGSFSATANLRSTCLPCSSLPLRARSAATAASGRANFANPKRRLVPAGVRRWGLRGQGQ